jgi:hypothetical protein
MSLAIETPSRIEPCLLEQTSPAIVDLVASLSAASSRLGARLHPRSAASLADAVRIMNCYYSNLIEGHNTLHQGSASNICRDDEPKTNHQC